jgi:hypothetical protein
MGDNLGEYGLRLVAKGVIGRSVSMCGEFERFRQLPMGQS